MKTINRLLVLTLAVLALSSCVKEGIFGVPQVTLALQTDGVDLVTKATEAGQDEYNENLIGTIHWYFFEDDGDDDTDGDTWITDGTQAVNKTISSDVSLSGINTTTFNTIFTGSRTSVKVLVIANVTGAPAGSSGKTLADIKATALALTDHGPQTSFAMSGEGVLSKGTGYTASTTSAIELKRIASKFRIKLAIKNNYHNTTDGSDWAPDVADLLMSFKNLEPNGKVSGVDANSTTLNTVSFTISDFTKTSAGSTTTPFTDPQVQTLTDPIYSYPRTWIPEDTDYPYIYITLPWTSDTGSGSKTERTYYKVIFPTSSFDSNSLYDLTINLDGLGSMVPESSVTVDDMSLIVNGTWKDAIAGSTYHDTDAEMFVPHVLAVDKNEYVIYNQNSISIPFVSSHSCTYTADINSTVRTDNHLPENQNSRAGTISGITIQVDTTGNVINFNHNLINMTSDSSDKGYDYQELVYVIKLYHKSDPSVFEYITIRQRPSLCVSKESSETTNANVFVHGSVLTDGGNAASPKYDHSYRTLKTSSTSGGRALNIQRITAGVLPTEGTLSGFMIGDPRDIDNPITLNESGTTHFSDLLGNAIVYHNDDGGRYYVGTGYTGTPVGPSATVDDTKFNFSVPSYVSSSPSFKHIDGTTPNPNNIHIYYPSKETATNIIAPEFLITSYLPGVTSHYMNLEAATLRCAAYQEMGYPAGRWRLPTMAELTYLARLQQDDKIDDIFNFSGASYVGADGLYKVNGTGVSKYTSGTDYQRYYGSVRCVYDSWYWDQVDAANGWDATRSDRLTTYTYGDMEIE